MACLICVPMQQHIECDMKHARSPLCFKVPAIQTAICWHHTCFAGQRTLGPPPWTEACAHAGASVQAYYLGGYRTSAIVPGGNLTLLRASAAQSGGRLQATFRLLLPGSAAALAATPLPVLAAGSGLDSAGGLQKHAADEARPLAPTMPAAVVAPTARSDESVVPQACLEAAAKWPGRGLGLA